MTKSEIAKATLSELIEAWSEQEGHDGGNLIHDPDNFMQLIRTLDSNYESINDFLEDNPGATEAMVEWIGELKEADIWANNLRAKIKPVTKISVYLNIYLNKHRESPSATLACAFKSLISASPEKFGALIGWDTSHDYPIQVTKDLTELDLRRLIEEVGRDTLIKDVD